LSLGDGKKEGVAIFEKAKQAMWYDWKDEKANYLH